MVTLLDKPDFIKESQRNGRKTDEKKPFLDHFKGPDERVGVPLLAGCPELPTKPPKYSQKQKDLGVDRVAPDKLQPFEI